MFVNAGEIIVDTVDKVGEIKQSAIRLFAINKSLSGIDCLSCEQINILQTRWDIDHSRQIELLTSTILDDSKVPAVAFTEPGNSRHEIAARQLGIGVVVTDDIENEVFRELICELTSADSILALRASDAYFAEAGIPQHKKQTVKNKFFSLSSPLGFESVDGVKSQAQHANEHAFSMITNTFSLSSMLGSESVDCKQSQARHANKHVSDVITNTFSLSSMLGSESADCKQTRHANKHVSDVITNTLSLSSSLGFELNEPSIKIDML